MRPKTKSLFEMWYNKKDDTIYVRDADLPGFASVTNDAENVVRYVVNEFGNKRVLYYDTMGNLDEIVHDNGEFVGFRAGPARGQK